jgi:hypothetical protein
MKASGWIVLILVLAAVAVGIYILVAVAGGASFAFGGAYLPKWAPIPIALVLAVVFGLLFFRMKKK